MTNRELDWGELLGFMAAYAHSQRAKTQVLDIQPLPSPERAEQEARDVLQAQILLTEPRLPEFSVLDEVVSLFERLRIHAVLDLKELSRLRFFLNTASQMKLFLKSARNSWGEAQHAKISDFKAQLSAIDRVVTGDGEINENASPTLASLCEEKRRLTRDIAKTMDQIVARRKMEPILQDKYVTNREGRMVIPVKSGSQHDIKGLIHDASQTKQTVFIEPDEVIPANNRLREVQMLIQEEIYRILKELSEFLTRALTSFENADRSLLECDVALAKARLNQRLSGTLVVFSKEGILNLKDVRHPLLQIQGIKVVANTISLNKSHPVLLLSGPNAGGKTVLLKALGLAVQMARCGLPAAVSEGSEIPFFGKWDPIIGDLQSVDQNLSSFSSHIQRLIQALNYNGPGTLILVDEICGATDPEEGAALARSFIEHFCHQKVFALITSHLGPLKENWDKESGVLHASLEFDNKTNKPTYQLLMGFPGRSLALSVAQRLGVPVSVIERARSYLAPTSQARSKELEEIEAFKTQVRELKTQAQADREEAQRQKTQYTELVRKFREQRDRWLEKALEKAEKKIENLIEAARLQRLKDKTLHDIKGELPEIIKGRTGPARPQTLEEFKAAFKPGTPAFSSRLGRQVLIQSEPDAKGQVSVLADSMRVQLPWHTLTSSSGADEGVPTVVRRSGSSPKSDESPMELDLRGHRVDEALDRLEKWLDDCLREQKDRVKVIHGFGTEQLKKSIRQFLSKSRYVAKWSPGDTTAGGDGVTWIDLAD